VPELNLIGRNVSIQRSVPTDDHPVHHPTQYASSLENFQNNTNTHPSLHSPPHLQSESKTYMPRQRSCTIVYFESQRYPLQHLPIKYIQNRSFQATTIPSQNPNIRVTTSIISAVHHIYLCISCFCVQSVNCLLLQKSGKRSGADEV
jgi:hypothetical protein